MTDPKRQVTNDSSRRSFLATTGGVAAFGALAGSLPTAYAAGSDVIKVGLIGCGGRGRGAAEQCVNASSNVRLVAMGDAFADNLASAHESLSNLGDRVAVPADRRFVGLDAYKHVLESDVDLVILATPPGFRPDHLESAINAGKHVFTEKPVAVDGTGIRKVLKVAEEAKKKNLAVVAGTQRRHQAGYIEAMKRIHEGEIGDVVSGRCYWNQGPLWNKPRQASWTDVEWQMRNWLYFTWLSGDHIVEQHVHNLDVLNWAIGSHPLRAVSLGGRQVRTDPAYGHIFDHFATDLEYANDVHVLSFARQIEGCENNVSEAVVGTKGSYNLQPGQYKMTGGTKFRWRDKERNPYEQEHIDLIESIRSGKPLNELKTVAESTLTAIMSRMSAYTGKAVTWEQALESKLDLKPKDLAFGPLEVPPVAMPGITELI
ncbi:Gfo/Idh/MocA family oxidoreductase [Isosphaeraceae bacterium EP7]